MGSAVLSGLWIFGGMRAVSLCALTMIAADRETRWVQTELPQRRGELWQGSGKAISFKVQILLTGAD